MLRPDVGDEEFDLVLRLRHSRIQDTLVQALPVARTSARRRPRPLLASAARSRSSSPRMPATHTPPPPRPAAARRPAAAARGRRAAAWSRRTSVARHAERSAASSGHLEAVEVVHVQRLADGAAVGHARRARRPLARHPRRERAARAAAGRSCMRGPATVSIGCSSCSSCTARRSKGRSRSQRPASA